MRSAEKRPTIARRTERTVLAYSLHLVYRDGKPIEKFRRIEFHSESLPIVHSCQYVRCKNLLPDGTIFGCCAKLCIPGSPLIDSRNIFDQFDPAEFMQWYMGDRLSNCNHCSVATKGEQLEAWELGELAQTSRLDNTIALAFLVGYPFALTSLT